MAEGIGYSVIVDMCRHIVGRGFHRVGGITHGHTDACGAEDRDVVTTVAEGRKRIGIHVLPQKN